MSVPMARVGRHPSLGIWPVIWILRLPGAIFIHIPVRSALVCVVSKNLHGIYFGQFSSRLRGTGTTCWGRWRPPVPKAASGRSWLRIVTVSVWFSGEVMCPNMVRGGVAVIRCVVSKHLQVLDRDDFLPDCGVPAS